MPLSLPPPPRALKWLAATLAALVTLPVLAVLVISVVGWNWARAPLHDLALRKTGRVLQIDGDLQLALAWPLPRLRAQGLRFANPTWARAPQMLSADAVEVSIDLPELLRGRLAFPEVRLVRPQVFLERGSGERKNWLLDLAQIDPNASIPIGRVLLDLGEVSFIDAAQGTELHATLATAHGNGTARPLFFGGQGRFRGEPVTVQGSGGAVLAMRDEREPYPLQLLAHFGPTQVEAEGTVTSLLTLRALDMQLALRGDSLAALFPLIGIALPPTPAYRSRGRLVHTGTAWRYVGFTGEVGRSDLASTLQLAKAGARPRLTGTVTSRRLDLADLGPAVGAREAPATPATPRVLPDLPFDTARWDSLDADVTLQAQALLRAKALQLNALQVRLQLQDRQLTLDPLSFGLAGGQVNARVKLDGRTVPLRGHTTLKLRGLQLARLMPSVDFGKADIGRLDGEATLEGQGATVGRMLAVADGRLSLVAQNGQISRLLMEQIGLHLLEILRLNLTGDQTIALHCAVADFDVAQGVMRPRALVLDTAVSTVTGSGNVNLAQETLDLSFEPRTKVSSLLALRSPVHVRGHLGRPTVTVDSGRIVARGAGALALGLLNPLLALIPLFEAGPGADSPCGQLVREARAARPS